MNPQLRIQNAARAISKAQAILICAGAGMGVDSGLPDFRGNEGFWNAYPPFRKLGLDFIDLANPRWFRTNPAQAWGFYGHRLHQYRDTTPHQGFKILQKWTAEKLHGSFIYTSNVDGHFQASGFTSDQILECHGSISILQCSENCCPKLWSANPVNVSVDESTMQAAEPLPKCPFCEAVARPNILMFGDGGWVRSRTEDQQARFNSWLSKIPSGALTVIEIGAGTAIPSVRKQSENLLLKKNAKLVRINPRESSGPQGTISIPGTALESLQALDQTFDHHESSNL